MTPRVTYEGDIILDLIVESSTLGPSISVAGQDLPSFGSRKVKTRCGCAKASRTCSPACCEDDQRKILPGLPGLMQVPILDRSLARPPTKSARPTSSCC